MKDSDERFTDRVEDYAKYRPHYPEDLYHFLRQNFLKGGPKVIADIGSGTGISSGFFLKEGHAVFAIEPNDAMREKSIRSFDGYTGFFPLKGKAEDTGLVDNICDLIYCAQSFHWFDIKSSLKEFKRIAKKNGHVLLVWNDRNTSDSEFSKEYEDFIISHAVDYGKVNHKRMDLSFLKKNIPFNVQFNEFPNVQELTMEGLRGRVLSSSYMPDKQHPDFSKMIEDLEALFTRHSFGDKVRITYTTRLFYFSLNGK